MVDFQDDHQRVFSEYMLSVLKLIASAEEYESESGVCDFNSLKLVAQDAVDFVESRLKLVKEH